MSPRSIVAALLGLTRRPERLALWCSALVALLYAAALVSIVWGESDATGAAAVAGSLVVAMAAATSAAVVIGRTSSLDDADRRSWLLLGASLLTWCVGSASWALSHAAAPGRATSSSGDLWFVGTVALYSIAVLGQRSLAAPGVRVRAALDGLIVGAASSVVLWFVAGRAMYARTDDALATLSAMSYPLADLALVVVSMSAMAQARRRSAQESLLFLATVAFAAIAFGDVAALVSRAYDVSPGVSLLSDAGWVVGLVCLGCAALYTDARAYPLRTPVARDRVRARLDTIPAAAAVAAVLATAFDALLNGRLGPTGWLLLTVTIALVLVRQSLTLAENRHLADSLQRLVEDLAHQAGHDALTGLPNRSCLHSMVEDAIEVSVRRHRHAALMFLDLDHLKAINDSLGHHAGDRVLRTIAERLQARVGPTVARFGGDEFVVVLDDVPSMHALRALGEAIVEDAATPTEIDGHTLRPSASVGMVIVETGVGIDELLRRADVALYRAKTLGRARVVRYDPHDPENARRQVDMEPQLRRALERDEFEVHYQPVIELPSGRLHGVEALLRWRHPEHGLLAPGAFLAEATTAGLLGAIGARTLEIACADHSRSGIRVAVNLSTAELVDPALITRVRGALEAAAMDPRQLTIEITEDVIVDDAVGDTIEQLRSLGIGLAIDDFGTGNSSLRQLGSYPADYLKLDRSFVSRLGVDRDAEIISGAVLRLADDLDLRAVAEGVETEVQAAVLIELGCSLAQGYLFAAAMPLSELLARFPRGRRVHVPGIATPAGEVLPGDQEPSPARRASASSASATMRSSSSDTGGRSETAPTT